MPPAGVTNERFVVTPHVGYADTFARIACIMSNRELADKDLRCVTCGDGFVFSAGEQELFRLRGITEQPEHCPSCTRSHGIAPLRVATNQATA